MATNRANHRELTPHGANNVGSASDNQGQITKIVSEASGSETECVPDLPIYKDNRDNRSESSRYLTDTTPITSSLNKRQIDMINEWLASDKSQMLSIVAGEDNSEGLPWTTSVVLVIKELIERAIEKSAHTSHDNIVVTHLCDRNIVAKDEQREIILVQDLLRQVLKVHENKFGKLNAPLEKSEFPITSENPEDLWRSLKTSIIGLKIYTIAIMLGNVEMLLPGAEFSDFVYRLNRLRTSLWEDKNLIVKVLATSRKIATRNPFTEIGVHTIVLTHSPSQKRQREYRT